MPTALLKSYHEKYDIPIKKLEKMWEKSKSIVNKKKKEGDKDYYPNVVHILKNMMTVEMLDRDNRSHSTSINIDMTSESKVVPKAKPKSKANPMKAGSLTWWDRMGPKSQRRYLSDHPGSAMNATLKKRLKPLKEVPKAKESKESHDDALEQVVEPPKEEVKETEDGRDEKMVEADTAEVARQAEVVEEHKDDKPSNPTPKQRSILRNLFMAGGKAMKGVYSSVRDATKGTIEEANKDLQNYVDGSAKAKEAPKEAPEESEEEGEEDTTPKSRPEAHSRALKIVGAVALGCLLGAIGIGILMMAPTMAPLVADAYFNSRKEGSTEGYSESSEDSTLPTNVDDLTKDFADWLSHQDVEKMVADHEAKIKKDNT